MKLSKVFYSLAILSLLTVIALVATGNKLQTGPAVIFLFFALSIAFRGSERMKGFS